MFSKYFGFTEAEVFGSLDECQLSEFRDNVKAHILQPTGEYEKQDKRGKALVNSQMEFYREAHEKAAVKQVQKGKSRVFIPAEPAVDIEEK